MSLAEMCLPAKPCISTCTKLWMAVKSVHPHSLSGSSSNSCPRSPLITYACIDVEVDLWNSCSGFGLQKHTLQVLVHVNCKDPQPQVPQHIRLLHLPLRHRPSLSTLRGVQSLSLLSGVVFGTQFEIQHLPGMITGLSRESELLPRLPECAVSSSLPDAMNLVHCGCPWFSHMHNQAAGGDHKNPG